MKQTLKIIFVSALATAALIKGVPALAETAPAETVAIVHTADLDLASAEGRQTLDRRLKIAARDVCGVASDADLEGKKEVRRCRDQVLARANAQREQILATSADGATIALSSVR